MKDVFRIVSKEDFFGALDYLSDTRPRILLAVRSVKIAYEKEIQGIAGREVDEEWENALTERQAVSALEKFQIDYRALRSWAKMRKMCRFDSKKSRGFVYHKAGILNLADDYFAFKEAMGLCGLSKAHLHRKIHNRCRKLRIGQRTLILKEDFMDILFNYSFAVF